MDRTQDWKSLTVPHDREGRIDPFRLQNRPFSLTLGPDNLCPRVHPVVSRPGGPSGSTPRGSPVRWLVSTRCNVVVPNTYLTELFSS